MRTNNVLILSAVIIILLCIIGYTVPTILNPANNTTDNDSVNLTVNNTTNTTDTTDNQTTTQNTQINTQKDTQKSSSSDDGITYDEKLNAYFDKNGKTAYDGQFPKGTSRQELEEYSHASLD